MRANDGDAEGGGEPEGGAGDRWQQPTTASNSTAPPKSSPQPAASKETGAGRSFSHRQFTTDGRGPCKCDPTFKEVSRTSRRKERRKDVFLYLLHVRREAFRPWIGVGTPLTTSRLTSGYPAGPCRSWRTWRRRSSGPGSGACPKPAGAGPRYRTHPRPCLWARHSSE